MKFGPEVRRRRKALGWTLEDLAERCGMTPHHLSAIETDKGDPKLSTIIAIAKALGRVPPGQLLGATDGVSPTAMEVARLYDAAVDNVKDGVLKILRASGRARR
ncbi:MAG: helix-turn-helix transcriptional regulator [Polyangiaceae bacterium]